MQKRVYAKRTLEGIEVAAWSERAGQDVVVGVDVSKATLELVIRWADRVFERPITVPNPGGIPEAMTRLGLLHEGRALKVALEPSGTYGDAFRQACHDADLTVWRVRPKAAHDYAEVFDGVPSQHDGKDGAIIAELAAIGKAEVWPYAAERESDQRLKLAADLVEAYARQLAAWNGRIEGWLGRHWPEIAATWAAGTPTLHRVLARYGSPAAWATDAQAESRIRGWGGPLLKPTTIPAVLEAAKRTVGVRCTAVDQERIRVYVAEASRARQAWQAAYNNVKRLSRSHETIPRMAQAVGLATAAVLYARIGAPQNYTCGRAYVKALGLNLTERSSGRYQGLQRISKRGDPQARRWLYLSALRQVHTDGVSQWYARKAARDGGRRLPGVVAVMRKLALGLWRADHDGVPFDSRRLFAPGGRRKEFARSPARSAVPACREAASAPTDVAAGEGLPKPGRRKRNGNATLGRGPDAGMAKD